MPVRKGRRLKVFHVRLMVLHGHFFDVAAACTSKTQFCSSLLATPSETRRLPAESSHRFLASPGVLFIKSSPLPAVSILGVDWTQLSQVTISPGVSHGVARKGLIEAVRQAVEKTEGRDR